MFSKKAFFVVFCLKRGLKTKSDAKVALLAAKRRQNLTFAEMADKLAANKVRLSAAIFGEQPFDKDTAARALQLLDLSDDRLLELMQERPEIRGQNEHFFGDPLIARLLEVIRVYGPTLKAIVEEENGNGIVSAVDCRLACDKYDDANGTRRVRITIDGKFLEYK